MDVVVPRRRVILNVKSSFLLFVFDYEANEETKGFLTRFSHVSSGSKFSFRRVWNNSSHHDKLNFSLFR